MDSKLATIIRKQAKPKLITSAILIIIVLVLFFFYRSFIKSKTIGSDTVTTVSELMEHFDSGDTYVKVHADELYPIDLVVETTTTNNGTSSKKNTSFFAVADFDEMLIIVELPYRLYDDEGYFDNEVVLTGKLKESTTDFNVLGEVSDILAEIFEMPRNMVLEEVLVPLYLGTLEDTTAIMLNAIGAIILFFAIISLIINVIRISKPRSHRIFRQLGAFGDPELVEAALEREIADGSSSIITHPSKYEYLTNTYILSLKKNKLTLGKTEDVVWAYRRDVKNRGAVTHYIVLRMNDWKSRRTLTARQPADAENALNSIAGQLPILCGYSSELETIYNKNHDEFQRLLSARRAEFNAASRPVDTADGDTVE